MHLDNIIYDKALAFGERTVALYKWLTKEDTKEYVISKQVLKSGTSIGANVSESIYAESAPDFVHKLQIAQKEACETRYWIELLHRTEYLNDALYMSLKNEVEELLKMLTSIITTTKKRNSLL